MVAVKGRRIKPAIRLRSPAVPAKFNDVRHHHNLPMARAEFHSEAAFPERSFLFDALRNSINPVMSRVSSTLSRDSHCGFHHLYSSPTGITHSGTTVISVFSIKPVLIP